jgi:hypothetical protein
MPLVVVLGRRTPPVDVVTTDVVVKCTLFGALPAKASPPPG